MVSATKFPDTASIKRNMPIIMVIREEEDASDVVGGVSVFLDAPPSVWGWSMRFDEMDAYKSSVFVVGVSKDMSVASVYSRSI